MFETIFSNMKFLAIANMVNKVLAPITTILTIRILGKYNFGVFSYAMSISTLISIFYDCGISSIVTRDIAIDNESSSDYLINGITIKISLIGVTMLISFATLNIIGYKKEDMIILMIVLLWNALTSITTFILAIFRAFNLMFYEAFFVIVDKILTILILIFLMIFSSNLQYYIWGLVLDSCITTMILCYAFLRNTTIRSLKLKFSLWKYLLRQGFPLIFTNILIVIYFKIDSIMIQAMKGYNDVAVYNAAYRLLENIMMMHSIVSVSILPTISRKINNENVLRGIYNKCQKLYILFIPPIIIGTIFTSKSLILFLFGNEFRESFYVLNILIFTVLFSAFNQLFGTHLLAHKKQKITLVIIAIGAVFNILCNLYLVPRYSYIGASIATVLTEITMLIIYIIYMVRTRSFKFEKVINIRNVLIALSFLAIFLYVLRSINVFIVITLSVIIYPVLLIRLKEITNNEVSMVGGYFKNKSIFKAN